MLNIVWITERRIRDPGDGSERYHADRTVSKVLHTSIIIVVSWSPHFPHHLELALTWTRLVVFSAQAYCVSYLLAVTRDHDACCRHEVTTHYCPCSKLCGLSGTIITCSHATLVCIGGMEMSLCLAAPCFLLSKRPPLLSPPSTSRGLLQRRALWSQVCTVRSRGG